MIGRDLDSFYRLEQQVSAGWLAVTYRARRLEYGSVVAVKLFRAELGSEALRSFEAEVAAWEALRHPNISAMIERGLHAGRPWIASRWLQGESLATRIASGPLQLPAALMIFRPLMAALASAHAARLAHRNLKLSNVFLEQRDTQRRERVQLLDFMPAPKLVNSSAPATSSAYLAPEVLQGGPGDARSDVYAAGVVLIAMLTGVNSGSTLEPARSVPSVPGALRAWMRRATDSQRARRFANAGDMLGELIDVLPRELRSVQTPSDELKRAGSQPPAAAKLADVLPKRPRRISPAATTSAARAPSPLTAAAPIAPVQVQEDLAPITVPPPPRVPIEARSLVDVEAPSPSETRSAPDPTQSPPDEGGKSVRPIESRVVTPRVEPWTRLPMAAGAIGVVLLAGLTLFKEMKQMERGHARVSVSERTAAIATTTVAPEAQQPMAPEPAAPQLPAAAAPASPAPPHPAARQPPPVSDAPPPEAHLKIVAAPGHPPIRDPWSDPMPAELKRLHDLAMKGALADEPKVKALLEYNRDHHDDVRGYLVIGQLYLNRLWRTDCVEEWATALQRDPGVRGAPEVLPGLIEIIMHGKAAPIAQPLVLKTYGTEALAAVEDALDTVRNAEAAGRLHNLHLKITDSLRPE